jgi:dihydrofolate reductase
MGQLNAFVHVTIDGFFAGPDGEIDWFKHIGKDDEYDRFTHESASGGSTLVMGRKTYDMMKSYWPTPQASEQDPRMAEVLTRSPKIVFSRTLKSAPDEGRWKNTRVVHEIDPGEVRKLKDGKRDLTILGSGSILQQLTNLGLVDEYALVVVPIVLGKGRALFEDVKETGMRLVESRGFGNGLTLLRYGPNGAA